MSVPTRSLVLLWVLGWTLILHFSYANYINAEQCEKNIPPKGELPYFECLGEKTTFTDSRLCRGFVGNRTCLDTCEKYIHCNETTGTVHDCPMLTVYSVSDCKCMLNNKRFVKNCCDFPMIFPELNIGLPSYKEKASI